MDAANHANSPSYCDAFVRCVDPFVDAAHDEFCPDAKFKSEPEQLGGGDEYPCLEFRSPPISSHAARYPRAQLFPTGIALMAGSYRNYFTNSSAIWTALSAAPLSN